MTRPKIETMGVSLIIPIYQAAAFLEKNLNEIDQVLSHSTDAWELILVIDASPDNSLEICKNFAKQPKPYPIKILVNETNLGKGASVKKGMLLAQGKYRIFNDCDLAYPMSEVLKILDSLKQGAAISIASRAHPHSKYIFSPKNFRYLYTRHLASKVLNFIISKLFVPDLKDTQAGLKGFSAPIAEFIFSQLRIPGFSFDLELLYLANKSQIPIKEIPIHFFAQRVSTVNFMLEVFRTTRDMCKIYYWKGKRKYKFDLEVTSPEVF